MTEDEIAKVGETVCHPLWPELGTGEVLHITGCPHWTARSARVQWSTGQKTSHALSVLKVVDQ